MEFEELKDAYQKFKATIDLPTPKEMAAETRRFAEAYDRKFKRAQLRLLLLAILILVLLICCFNRRLPVLSNLGLIVMAFCSEVWVISTYMLKRRLRISHPERSAEEYDTEQKIKTDARIHHLQWIMICLLPGMCAGLLLWRLIPTHSNIETIVMVTIVVIGYAAIFYSLRQKLYKKLMPLLKDIDQDLQDLAKLERLPEELE